MTKTEKAISVCLFNSVISFDLDKAKVAKATANILINDVLSYLKEHHLELSDLPEGLEESIGDLVVLRELELITTKQLRAVLSRCLEEGLTPIDVFVRDKILDETDGDALQSIVQKVLTDNQKVVDQILGGNVKAKGFLVGQIMKATKGKANPQEVNSLIDNLIRI